MAIDYTIRGQILQYDINRYAAKIALSSEKKKNILQVKKYYHLIEVEWYSKPTLLILL